MTSKVIQAQIIRPDIENMSVGEGSWLLNDVKLTLLTSYIRSLEMKILEAEIQVLSEEMPIELLSIAARIREATHSDG